MRGEGLCAGMSGHAQGGVFCAVWGVRCGELGKRRECGGLLGVGFIVAGVGAILAQHGRSSHGQGEGRSWMVAGKYMRMYI